MSQSNDSTRPQSPRDGLDRLRRMLARAEPITSVLQKIAQLAHRAVPGSCGSSLTLVSGDGESCLAHAGRLARDLDEWQYSVGDGPCLTAARSNRIIEIVDVQADSRWSAYTSEALRRGAHSCLSIPVPVLQQGSAALTLYGGEPGGFDEGARQLLAEYGGYAAAALAYAYAEESLRAAYVEHLGDEPESGAVVEQAKGVLAERHKVTPDQALEALTRAALSTRVPLHEVAGQLVATGSFDRRYIEEVSSS